MTTLDDPVGAAPYGEAQAAREAFLLPRLNALTRWHAERSPEYARIVAATWPGRTEAGAIDAVPFLPVGLFKAMDLSSVAREAVAKILTSSGTTGQRPSRIFLDRDTAALQARALAAIATHWLGPKRLPMLVIDHRDVVRDRASFNARGAAVLGFSLFGHDPFYLLDADMKPDWEGLRTWLAKHAGRTVFVFGFTALVWLHLVAAAERDGVEVRFDDAILVHGGGWKKLRELEVSNAAFAARLRERHGIARVHNYYGMVEQTGSIYVECEHGHFHAPRFAAALVRDPVSFQLLPPGREGVVQVLSLLPRSYPGHSLLTEDLGVVDGVDDCPCGRGGATFRVLGRIPAAELRGCSDVLAAAA